jgi:CHAT domain-containing protein
MSATKDALQERARRLIAPLSVPPDVPLVVVPSGSLVNLMWSPLHSAPVSVTPSGSLWVRARHAARTVPGPGGHEPLRVALIAGPDLDGAGKELSAVGAEYPDARTLLPPYSTVDATVDLVKDADLAHFACHGRFRSDSPLFSALELSDGKLTLYEMLERGVAPRRMVLASCNSGTQQTYDGDEVLGFASAMMCNGSAGIVAAEMPIPDDACAAAMSVLHHRIRLGDSLAAAVWGARSALDGGGPEEYVAGCVLTAYGPG